MRPRISVNIPAYNCSAFINAAVDSALEQDCNLELLIVNDGSTDDTFHKIRQYRNNPRVRIFNQKHQGLSFSRQRLLKSSRGYYVAFLDGDDIMLPGRLKKQVRFLDSHKSYSACYGKAKLVDINLFPIHDKMFGKSFGKPLKKTWDIIEVPFHPGTLVIRKDKVLATGGFNSLFEFTDSDFIYRICESLRIYFFNSYFMLYRRGSGTATKSKAIWQEELLARKMAVQRRWGNVSLFSRVKL